MDWPDFDFVKHASEVVCVAIGANLLLPIVPSILRNMMSSIETDPEKIAKTKFKDLIEYISEDDLKHVGKVAKTVQAKIEECRCGQGWGWKTAELATAAFGVFMLWSNWIKEPFMAKWCIVLFLPPIAVVAIAYACYRGMRKSFDDEIQKTISNARDAKKKREEEKKIDNDEFVIDYVDKIRNAAKSASSAPPSKMPPPPPAHG